MHKQSVTDQVGERQQILLCEEPFRVCTQCGETKLIGDFVTRRKNGKHGKKCKVCDSKSVLKAYHARKNTPVSYEELFEKQCGRCAICQKKQPKRLAYDHNHKTNQWRGLLCSNCNLGIGNLHEDVAVLYAAIDYLEYWSSMDNFGVYESKGFQT